MNALKRVLRASIAVVAAALCLTVLAAALLVATPVGARVGLRAAADLVPGSLEVGSVRGTLATTIALGDVRYSNDTLRAELATVVVEPDWRALARGVLTLARLEAATGSVTLAPRERAAPDGRPPTLPELAPGTGVRRLSLADVTIEGLGAPIRIVRLDGRIDAPRLEVERLVLAAAGVDVDAAAAATLAPSGARGSIEGAALLPAAEPDRRPELELAGTFELATTADPWHVALDWSEATLRGSPAGDVTSPSGRWLVTPGTDPIRIEVAASVAADALPGRAELAADAALTADALELDTLTAEVLGGRIRARGAVALDGAAGFASVDFAELDPALLDPRLAGVIAGDVIVAAANAPRLVVTVTGNLAGRLGERPLDGRVEGSYAAGELKIARAQVDLDGGGVTVAGDLSDDAADLRVAVNLPELGHWYPPAGGAVAAAGTITGDPSNPTVEFDLTATSLALADSGVPPIAELTVAIRGERRNHSVRVDAATDFGRVALTATQSVRDRRIAGTLREAVLALERAGTWRLTAPAAYTVAGADVTVERACLAGPDGGELCVDARADRAQVVARALPNALANPWLPPDVTVAGALDADLEVAWRGPLAGSFAFRQPTLAIAAVPRDAEPAAEQTEDETAPVTVSAEIANLALVGSLTEEALAAELSATLAATGDPIAGRLTLAPPTAAGALDARLTARLTDLAVLDVLVDGVERLRGEIEVAIGVGGTLAAPEPHGTVTARSLSAALPPLGIEVVGGRFEADAAGLDAVEFRGGLCSDGCLRFTGRLAKPDAEPWRLDARLSGERFELVRLPDLRAVVSPNVTLQGGPDAWRAAGEVLIPSGAIEVESVPRSAVRPAPETVVHGRPERERERRRELPIPLAVDVTARLGDVRFTGLGIEAELDGALRVERALDGMLQVHGTTAISEGTFTAYAQTLTIERGVLIFTGSPDNPALDIRATRRVDGDLVGLNISGTALSPRSVVFSDPPLPESEAFARLLTGRSLATAGSAADPEALERAALGLGLRRAMPTLNRLGASLGLDELSVDSAEQGGALVAGKQLGEDVVLRYRHGLFEEFSGFELIYQITDRFRLRTETGTAQSIDLIYEVGRRLGGGSGPDPSDVAIDERAASPAEVVAPERPRS